MAFRGWRGALGGVVGAALALAAPAAALAAGDFPRGSLALGHPPLAGEHVASGGVISSRVPDAARLAAHELLVTFTPGTGTRLRGVIRTRKGLAVVGALADHVPVMLVRVRGEPATRAARWLRAQPGVRSVQADAVEFPDAACPAGGVCPNDPGFPYQWYLENVAGNPLPSEAGVQRVGADVDAPLAWGRTLGGSDVRIAIVDSGIDSGHPDLAGKVVAAANFTSSTTTADQSGHGTHVAGTAAASFDNGIGIAGMAPRARLMDIKVLAVDADGRTTGDCAGVADGILWATDHGADVINMSLGSPSPCQAIALAVDYAYAHGALAIAAAGNDGSTARNYPAAYNHVLSVAATTAGDALASFSNRGASWVDVAAPGSGIISTLPRYDNGTGAVGYGYLSGTSMATPIVSGLAALLWAQMPTAATNAAVEARLESTADAIAGTGTDWRFGLVDACRAIDTEAAPCGRPPSPPSPAPPATPRPPVAEPIAIGPPGPPPNAVRGQYTGSLGRRSLQLLVGDLGDALIRVRGSVPVKCGTAPTRRVALGMLSTTRYGRIGPNGGFRLDLRTGGRMIRGQRIRMSGSFHRAVRRATGSLRLTGRTSRGVGCDSRSLRWSARLTHPAP